MNLVWLGERAGAERGLLGGKAASLSALAADYPIPPGFCLTTAACDQAVEGGIPWPSLSAGATPLPTFPAPLRADLAVAYATLGERCGMTDPPVAVRSSAVDEDSRAASFAGQHETYLNVRGTTAIEAAIVRCWVSASSARARAYRRAHGSGEERVRLAVLIQHLVAADVSAVLFSANPLSGRRDEVLITASWGLGESIVGGTVTPDTYVVRKADRAVVSRQVAEKERMTVAVAEGTREVAVPRFLRTRPALTEAQVGALVRLGLSLEATMGWPVDAECAYQGDHLFLLQCRPITTLLEP